MSFDLKAWYKASRPPFYIATLVPIGLGAVLAAKTGPISYLRLALVLLGSFLVHLSTNLANDYFEHFYGTDEGRAIGGSRMIQEGRITPGSVLRVMSAFYMTAFLIGAWLVHASDVAWLWGVMIFAGLSSLFYTAKPIRYGYHGLGELFVGINMGPVIVAGTFAVLKGKINTAVLLTSIPIGILVALILFYQSIPDIETDRIAGKRTLAVKLGRKRVSGAFIFATFVYYLCCLGLYLLGLFSAAIFLCIFTFPLALRIHDMIKIKIEVQDLHGKGNLTRLFYLANGIVVIAAVI